MGETLRQKTIGLLNGGVSWASYDPTLQGNIPYLKFSIERSDQAQILHYIRMPSPTLNSNSSARVTPEFEAYLTCLKNRNLRHTYINFQDSVKPKFKRIKNLRRFFQWFGVANESHRAGVVEKLERNPRYRKTIMVLTLSRDSGFYRQSRLGDRKPKAARVFINEFFNEIFYGVNNGFHIPSEWKRKRVVHETAIREILDFVFEAFFRKNGDIYGEYPLDKYERRNFIEIAYAFIAEYAARGSFSVNQTCKSGIDRAGSANTMTLLTSALVMAFDDRTSGEVFEQMANRLVPMLFVDALAAKMREVKGSRFKRFYRAALWMTDHLTRFPGRAGLLRKQVKSVKPNFRYRAGQDLRL